MVPNMNEMGKETMGFDTLNPLIYKLSNALLLGQMVLTMLFLLATGVVFLFFPVFLVADYFWLMVVLAGATIFTGIGFVLLFLITATSLKRNDVIVIRKFRSAAGTISRINLQGKSKILFDPKDKTSEVTIYWPGAITDSVSGCKIIQLSEGKHINDNLNSQVSESEWDKDISKLTKAKSVADLAEAELFNQGFFGLAWQDIVLVVTALLVIGVLIYLIVVAPGSVAQETVNQLVNGAIQQAVAGIVTPVPVPTA
jgi:hypothetical protein